MAAENAHEVTASLPKRSSAFLAKRVEGRNFRGDAMENCFNPAKLVEIVNEALEITPPRNQYQAVERSGIA